ncbi:hypothetical protein PCC8801_1564 [Rippkaea orientalis PCC 8801]|uniref:Uncharacterized protein n=1 Tax=Rippkaea orientalis (strain PCC 8801 / RF-1) TaxID=41431 RepID=B7JUS2_RIPO1|nr:hypothetical protein PCC8801_1564 [Rippkaea orientalis PCC 8801]
MTVNIAHSTRFIRLIMAIYLQLIKIIFLFIHPTSEVYGVEFA